MMHSRQNRVAVAARYSQLLIGGQPAIKPEGDASLGRLAGVIVLNGVVYCRWQIRAGRVLVTASSARGRGGMLVAEHAANEDVVLLGLRKDGTQHTDATAHGERNMEEAKLRQEGTH
jgi:hypothetical protein